MSNSNYPAGVSDSHPYFNPPRESATAVECGADEALVLPFHAVRKELDELTEWVQMKPRTLEQIEERLGKISDYLVTLKQEREYECPFNDEVDLEESEVARWDCPVCGNERETDNLPEDRDPDYDYDRRGDDD